MIYLCLAKIYFFACLSRHSSVMVVLLWRALFAFVCLPKRHKYIQIHTFASLSHGSVMVTMVGRSVRLFVQGTSHCVPLSLESLLYKMSSHLSAEQKLQHKFILRNLKQFAKQNDLITTFWAICQTKELMAKSRREMLGHQIVGLPTCRYGLMGW